MDNLYYGQYIDITAYAKKLGECYEDYERIYACYDTHDVWIARILKGYDENYDIKQDSYIVERSKFPHHRNPQYKDRQTPNFTTDTMVHHALDADIKDGFGNWDVYECSSLEDCIGAIDGGWGIVTGLYGDDQDK